eukprot:1968348-Rhodomonas_salina.2
MRQGWEEERCAESMGCVLCVGEQAACECWWRKGPRPRRRTSWCGAEPARGGGEESAGGMVEAGPGWVGKGGRGEKEVGCKWGGGICVRDAGMPVWCVGVTGKGSGSQVVWKRGEGRKGGGVGSEGVVCVLGVHTLGAQGACRTALACTGAAASGHTPVSATRVSVISRCPDSDVSTF